MTTMNKTESKSNNNAEIPPEMHTLGATKIHPDQLSGYNLTYVYETDSGIRRMKRGRGFSFILPSGATIKDKKERARLLGIAVPPTYENVWYCPINNGHLQATGYDSTSKKQYFYHSEWEKLRELSKFASLKDFGDALPSFRSKIARNIKVESLDKTNVLMAMARILDRTGMRVGSQTATTLNETYGLTTLEKDHVDLDESHVAIHYKGKGGVDLNKEMCDAKVANIIDNCVEISGQRLFEYIDDDDNHHPIDSGDLNAFLKDNLGQQFSAKDFRTWRFSCLFLKEALRLKNKQDLDKVTLKAVLENVAEISGNTISILKSSYIHPDLLDIVRNDDWGLIDTNCETIRGLRKSETQFLNYLRTAQS